MSVTTTHLPKSGDRMTLEEFRALNLPEESSLILLNGVVYDEADESTEMTRRNHLHSFAEANLAYLLNVWQRSGHRKCRVYAGEVGCELTGQILSVGIDVAVFDESVVQKISGEFPYIIGVPLLAIEILSPSDKTSEIQRKVDLYLAAGVSMVWVVDTHFKTVIVHQDSHVPEMFATGSSLSGGAALPGLSIPVADIFS